MWKDSLLLVIICSAVASTGAVLCGRSRWEAGTKLLREELEAGRADTGPKVFDSRELEGLPVPVQRYFHAVLKEGQSMVRAVDVVHRGTFNLSGNAEQWKTFTSTQRVVMKPPGFDWDGRIAMVPGLNVYVHDAYVAGRGILQAALPGLVTLADMSGTAEVAEGELMRFLAEAAWYPTALLPGQGVRWEAVDERSARATLRDGGTSVTLLYRFNEAGLIDAVRAEARGRTVGRKVVPTPWEGRWKGYETRDGMLVPLEGEVAWMFPQGPKPYWRGRIVSIVYEFQP